MKCLLIFSKTVFTAELIVSYPKDGDYSRRSTKYTEKEAIQLLDTHNKENLQIQLAITVDSPEIRDWSNFLAVGLEFFIKIEGFKSIDGCKMLRIWKNWNGIGIWPTLHRSMSNLVNVSNFATTVLQLIQGKTIVYLYRHAIKGWPDQ